MSQSHLILISIGPVQELIASARKLRDLWFGSHMLSELSKTVARALRMENAELVFPSPTSDDELIEDSALSVANKILAALPSGSDPEAVALRVQEAWREQWRHYAEDALDECRRIGKFRIREEMYWKQVEDLGEFYAVWVPVNAGNYKEARDRVETLLLSRKSLRNFPAPQWDGASHFKSSLDGIRESVIVEKPSNGNADRIPEIKGLLKKNERLDAMGIIKRFYPMGGREKKVFDDLSDVAILPWLDRIDAMGLNHEFEEFEALFTSKDDETKSKDARNKSRLHCKLLSQSYFEEHLQHDPANRDKIEVLQTFTRKLDAKPNPYASILVGDGDKMGAALDQLTDIEHHKRFSKELARFATEAASLVADYDGCLIYSGGDDVMAYLPLHTALEAAAALQQCFEECMQRCKQHISSPFDLPTFSAGLAIVHHVEPLSNALDLARKAEKLAKNEGGRDALAILQNKRSGGAISICGKWGDEKTPGLCERLKHMCALYDCGHLPGTLPYQLREIQGNAGDELRFEEENGLKRPLNAASALVKRLLIHKENSNEERKEQDVESLLCGLLPKEGSLRDFSDQMILARVFQQAISLANPKKEKKV